MAADTAEIHGGRSGKSGKSIEIWPVCAKIANLRQGVVHLQQKTRDRGTVRTFSDGIQGYT